MIKRYTTVLSFAGLFIASGGVLRSAYSYELVLMMPPILAGAQQDNVIGWQPLNDTGITWSGNYASGNNTAWGCVSSTSPDGDNVVAAQDCSHGRDATNNDDSDGHAGFSYTKLDSNGEPLPNQTVSYTSTPWACVKDNVTGLIWEVKTNDGGLHDKDDTYTWYNTDPASNGGANGDDGAAKNTCYGWSNGNSTTYCNTQAYVSRVNAAGWCGATNWRMPTVKELESLVHYDRYNPAADINYFPNIFTSVAWSGSPFVNTLGYAWNIYFDGGYSLLTYCNNSFVVWLVHDK